MNETILVTGGFGYIGSHIVMALANEGYRIVILDRVPNPTLYRNVISISCELQNAVEIKNAFDEIGNIACIIHCAGELGICRSYSQKNLFYKQNVEVTDNLLAAAIEHQVKNFIFASSAAVYSESNCPSSEASKISSCPSPYALSKIICEDRIRKIAQYSGLNYIVFRYFNVIGCDVTCKEALRYYVEKPNLLPNIVKATVNNEPISINGLHYETPDGTCVRDYINVIDLSALHVIAVNKMLTKWGSNLNGIYNVGSGIGCSTLDVIKYSQEIIGRPITVIERQNRTGDIPYLCSVIEKTNRVFGWRPQYSIKDTLQSLLSNDVLSQCSRLA